MNLKNLFTVALISALTLPAFAQSTLAPNSSEDSNQAQFTDQSAGQLSSPDDAILNSEARRPQRPHRPQHPHQPGYPGNPGYPSNYWICYSHDFFGGQYYGQSYNQRQARQLALRTCQAYAQTPVTVCFDDGCEAAY
jgi:hypothetical protein